MRLASTNYSKLADQAQRAALAASRDVRLRTALVGDARRELQLAATWHLRRSGVAGSIDQRIFAHGSNEQALGGLDICPIAMLGFKAAGAEVYPWLLAAGADGQGSYVDHVREALRDPKLLHYCVSLGAYHRFQFKAAVYQREVSDWKKKPVAIDPSARWRRRPITAKQRYLIALVAECLSAIDAAFSPPSLNDRGTAHDWLAAAGGRPYFWHPPQRPIFINASEI